MAIASDYSGESVVVIGGGLAGCFAACELRRLGYGEVILLERLGGVCGVGPRVVSELHAGGEYPFDARSAVDCLHGLVVLLRSLPGKVLTKPRTQLLVSRGVTGTGLDGERYAAHLTMLQREFENMVRADPALETEICTVTDFWRRLEPSEYADVINVAAGFETPQRGVQPDVLSESIKQMLASRGVDVRPLHDVRTVRRSGVGSFRVSAVSPSGEVAVDCSQVIFANHAHGFQMMMELAGDRFRPPPIFLGLRMMVLVEYGADRPFPVPSRLMLEGEFGAMDAPIDQRRSLVYYPPLSHRALIELEPPYRVPDWLARRVVPGDGDPRTAQGIVDGAATVAYPYLAGSSVSEPRMAIAVNDVADSRVRRNKGLLKPTMDCISLSFATKATTTALNAVRAAAALSRDADARRRPVRV